MPQQTLPRAQCNTASLSINHETVQPPPSPYAEASRFLVPLLLCICHIVYISCFIPSHHLPPEPFYAHKVPRAELLHEAVHAGGCEGGWGRKHELQAGLLLLALSPTSERLFLSAPRHTTAVGRTVALEDTYINIFM